MENRSLDDFLDDENPESDPESVEHAEVSEGDPAGEGEVSGDATWVDPEGVEPATTTYAAGAGECAACGETVRERWRGEAGLVCPACKEW